LARNDRSLLSCGEVRERIYPLLLRTVSEKERRDVLNHTETCDACRLALDAVQGRLQKIVDVSAPQVGEIRREARRKRQRLLRLFLSIVPTAVAFGLLFQQGIKMARYRYEQRFIARLEKAIYSYRLDLGGFPPSDVALSVYLGTHEGGGPYLDLDKERIDASGHFIDHWGNRYFYVQPGEHNDRLFDIHSFGQNSRDDGGHGDDVRNWDDDWRRIPPS